MNEKKYEINQLKILKEKLEILHQDLTKKKNTYAAGYLGVTIDELQEAISAYIKPPKTSNELKITNKK